MDVIMFFVYAIFNKKHNKIYIGETQNIEERLMLHNSRTFKNSFTSRSDGVWSLIFNESFETRQLARSREKQLKSYRGRQYIKTYIPR